MTPPRCVCVFVCLCVLCVHEQLDSSPSSQIMPKLRDAEADMVEALCLHVNHKQPLAQDAARRRGNPELEARAGALTSASGLEFLQALAKRSLRKQEAVFPGTNHTSVQAALGPDTKK